jgi:hypothetical protein
MFDFSDRRSINSTDVRSIRPMFDHSDRYSFDSIDIRTFRSMFNHFERYSFNSIDVRPFRSIFVRFDRHSFILIDVRSFQSIFDHYERCLIDIQYLEQNGIERSDVYTYLGDNVSSRLIGVDLRDDVCSDDSSSYLFMLKSTHLLSLLSIEESCLLVSFAL